MKKKVALFECQYGFHSVYDMETEKYTKAVRVSDYVEVDFPLLAESVIVAGKVEAIDKEVEAIKEKAMWEVSALQVKRQELLALTASANA